MIIIGIDPGKTGAIAAVESSDFHVVDVMDLPWIEHEINYGALNVFLRDWPPSEVLIEKAQAMPKQGVSSMFNYGFGYGQVVGICKALFFSYSLIRPQTWKAKELRDMPKEKFSSVLRCNQLYPELKLRTTQHGRADAILIARYGAGLNRP